MKCRSTFVRRDLLLRHDRTVHAKDGGVPLHSDGKRRAGGAKARAINGPAKSSIALDTSTLSEQIEASSEGIFDVEHAAMLVADLHHKATAAVRDNDASSYTSSPTATYSASGAPLMDPAVIYPPANAPLPQNVPWDAFMAQSVAEVKAQSAASSGAGAGAGSRTFESQQSFASVSTAQAHAIPLLVTESSCNGLIPALQFMIKTTSPTSTSTFVSSKPTAHSRRISKADQNQASAGFKAPQVLNDEDRNMNLDNIRPHYSEHAIPEGFHVPNLGSMNRYLATYFGLFHHHLPFLHPSSFNVTQVSPAILLAVLSIGALYAFDQDQAYMLHIGSKVLVNQFLQNKENFSSRKCPLWTMQSSLLNMIFASWSGVDFLWGLDIELQPRSCLQL